MWRSGWAVDSESTQSQKSQSSYSAASTINIRTDWGYIFESEDSQNNLILIKSRILNDRLRDYASYDSNSSFSCIFFCIRNEIFVLPNLGMQFVHMKNPCGWWYVCRTSFEDIVYRDVVCIRFGLVTMEIGYLKWYFAFTQHKVHVGSWCWSTWWVLWLRLVLSHIQTHKYPNTPHRRGLDRGQHPMLCVRNKESTSCPE